MMWGPGVARVAADLVVARADGPDRRAPTSVSTASTTDGRSRLATDPIALPFPVSAD